MHSICDCCTIDQSSYIIIIILGVIFSVFRSFIAIHSFFLLCHSFHSSSSFFDFSLISAPDSVLRAELAAMHKKQPKSLVPPTKDVSGRANANGSLRHSVDEDAKIPKGTPGSCSSLLSVSFRDPLMLLFILLIAIRVVLSISCFLCFYLSSCRISLLHLLSPFSPPN